MEGKNEAMLAGRNYQIEMLQESMARNIIVAMDTGSGKTQIAILRISFELERCPVHQFVWFLCPTVALARQQHAVISLQLPQYPSLLLVGNDGVDRWSTRKIWDDALHNIRIAVSTPKVLLDALLHSLVRMDDLALLVFDEAHHCQNEDAGNRIMIHVYHPRRRQQQSVPHILGLTASPLGGSSTGALQKIESNLNAISKTPKAHRDTYAQYVHLPFIDLVYYDGIAQSSESRSLGGLMQIYRGLNIQEDPFIKKRKLEGGDIEGILLSRKTYCQDQVKGLLTTATKVHDELGSWASERLISLCIEKLKASRQGEFLDLEFLDEDEKSYLERVLAPLSGVSEIADDEMKASVSAKVQTLIDILISEQAPGLAGLVFVETRATARLLAELLNVHPQTRTWARVASFVGESDHSKRKGHIKEVPQKQSQAGTLDDFRTGRKNLILTTSALEEGIDITACNLVICFQKPLNLRSFIQRRGRARKSKSKYIIMFEQRDKNHLITWQQLEEDMKAKYMDDMRELQELEQSEVIAEARHREFTVPSSGFAPSSLNVANGCSAKLMLQDATAHLYHFCHALPTAEYTAQDPTFIFTRDTADCVSARVLLPSGVDASVREFQGSGQWTTERAARSDAAFVAYVALYHAGLLNDHLLPLTKSAELEGFLDLPTVSSTMKVQGRINPWPSVSALWKSANLHIHGVHFSTNDQTETLFLVAPRQLPVIPAMTLYTDSKTTTIVRISPLDTTVLDSSTIQALRGITTTLYSFFCKGRMNGKLSDYPILFTPKCLDEDQQVYLDQVQAFVPASFESSHELASSGSMGLVQHASGKWFEYRGFDFREAPSAGVEATEPSASTETIGATESSNPSEMESYLTLKPISKRTDFLHPIPGLQIESLKSGQLVDLPARECTISKLPAPHAGLAKLLPSVLQQVENALVVEALCEKLKGCSFKNTTLLGYSITATASREAMDYQRLEFLGDSILKVMTSLALFSDHPNWHEGYLTAHKSVLVSNKRLALASQALGLDKYILTRPFTGLKWRPGYNSEILQEAPPKQRLLSTKTLADVTEALLGAAYLDGGHPTVCTFLLLLLPEIKWLSMTEQAGRISRRAEAFHSTRPAEQSHHLESLVQHQFSKPFLAIEAVTHPSHTGGSGDLIPSYQRLEFLGDAILDFIITERIYSRSVASLVLVHRMHLVRTAMVNANFLAFLGMGMTTAIQRNKISSDLSAGTKFRVETSTDHIALWQFLRFSQSHELAMARQRSAARFQELKSSISDALAHSSSYPWSLLIALAPEKFFSDIIESMLAAIYIDSAGSLDACTNFLIHLGAIPYLDRVLADSVKVLNPKEELGVLAVDRTVRYRVTESAAGFACEVLVAGESLALVPEQRTRMLAETLAAELAIERLAEGGSVASGALVGGNDTGGDDVAAEDGAEQRNDAGEDVDVEFHDAQEKL